MHRLPDSCLSAMLAEDLPHGDLTTFALGIGDRPGHMDFTARGAFIVACVEEAVRLVELAGGRARSFCASGTALADKQAILSATGPAEALLAAWKVAQTLVEATSGIATATRRLVEAADCGGGAAVACTRKTFPGSRAAALKAVMAGGGTPHRLGLSDSILLFPEHRVFLGADLAGAVARLRRTAPEKKVVAEAATLEDGLALAEAGVDVLQLEKFPPERVAAMAAQLAQRGLRPLLAAAGGIDGGNAEAYVRAGAKVLVTSSPYWAKPAEVQVTFTAGE